VEALLPFVVAVLFAGAFWCLLQRNLGQLVIGLLLLGNAANLALFSARGLVRALPPIVRDGVPAASHADPLPQALILTAIVIGMGVLAFALGLLLRLFKDTGVTTLAELGDEE
jgi:multicomponent Na+:H+ antiporter subunit C